MEAVNFLLVEDDLITARLIAGILESAGYHVVTAANGLEALDAYRKGYFPVVITDLEMPLMSGGELIDKLSAEKDPPQIIVLTGHDESSTIIAIMHKRVFHYIVKPVESADILFTVNRAVEHSRVVRANHLFENEKLIRLENQLEWYRWRERFVSESSGGVASSMFHGLISSFNQGAGFGALVTIVELLEQHARKTPEGYLVDADIFSTLIENNHVASKALDVFASINTMMTRGLALESFPVRKIYTMIFGMIEELEPFAGLKHQKLLLSDPKPAFHEHHGLFNIDSLRSVIRELVLNACKYSLPDTDIVMMLDVSEKRLRISVLSTPAPDEEGRRGIPVEYENLVFEPFFRLRKTVQESYGTLDFGLGLTLVEKAVQAHKGVVSIGTVKDHSALSRGSVDQAIERVSAVVTLPLADAPKSP